MGLLIYLALVLLCVVLLLARHWARVHDRARFTLIDIEDAQAQVVREIAARRRRAEEQMRRAAFRSWRP